MVTFSDDREPILALILPFVCDLYPLEPKSDEGKELLKPFQLINKQNDRVSAFCHLRDLTDPGPERRSCPCGKVVAAATF